MLTSLIFITVLLLLSAFFSGMEIAYVSSNKVQLEIEKKEGGVIGNILEKLTRKPSKFIATMLVGNNITLVIYGIEMGKLVVAQLPPYFHNVLWQTIISTLVIVITGEFLPKVFFQIYSNTLLRALSPITYVFYLIFSPVSTFVVGQYSTRVFQHPRRCNQIDLLQGRVGELYLRADREHARRQADGQ